MRKQKLQIVKFKVAKGETVEVNTLTKLEHDRVDHAFVRLSNNDALQGATMRMWIDSEDVLPDGTEVAIMAHTENMSITEVAYPIGEVAKNSKLRIVYKDNSENLAIDQEYEVAVYLMTSIEIK